MTEVAEDAVAFDRFLGASTPEIAEVARALRLTLLEEFSGAIEWFDPSNGLLALGTRARHVKVRSVEDTGSSGLRSTVAAQVALRTPPGD